MATVLRSHAWNIANTQYITVNESEEREEGSKEGWREGWRDGWQARSSVFALKLGFHAGERFRKTTTVFYFMGSKSMVTSRLI